MAGTVNKNIYNICHCHGERFHVDTEFMSYWECGLYCFPFDFHLI